MRNRRLPLVTAAALAVLALAACGTPDGARPASAATPKTAPSTAAPSSAPASAGELASPSASGITLRVTGSGAATAQVSYTVGTTAVEDKDATVPWQKTINPSAGVTPALSLIAMTTSTEDLTCEIFVDGTSVDVHTGDKSTGGVANCAWTGGTN